MTENKETPKWLTYYHQQLDLRNQNQSKAFRELIKNYSDIMMQSRGLEEKLKAAEREVMIVKSAQHF